MYAARSFTNGVALKLLVTVEVVEATVEYGILVLAGNVRLAAIVHPMPGPTMLMSLYSPQREV